MANRPYKTYANKKKKPEEEIRFGFVKPRATQKTRPTYGTSS